MSVKTNPATFRSFEAVPALRHTQVFLGFVKVHKYSRVHQSGVDHVSCKSSGSDGIQTMGLTEAHEPARLCTWEDGRFLSGVVCCVYFACCHFRILLPPLLILLLLQLEFRFRYQ